MRAGAVRLNFAAFVTQGWCVLLAEDDGLADVFEGPSCSRNSSIFRRCQFRFMVAVLSVLFG